MRLGVLAHKVRGFRVLDLAALFIVLALALSVYAFKTSAGAQRADIADVEAQIRDETRQVQLLRDEVDRLENPGALETAARADGQQPVDARQEVTPDALTTLVARPPAPGTAAASNAAAPPAPAAEAPR